MLQDTHILPFQMCSSFLMMNFFNLYASASEQSVDDIKTYPQFKILNIFSDDMNLQMHSVSHFQLKENYSAVENLNYLINNFIIHNA